MIMWVIILCAWGSNSSFFPNLDVFCAAFFFPHQTDSWNSLGLFVTSLCHHQSMIVTSCETAVNIPFQNDCKCAISERPQYERFSTICWVTQEQNPNLLDLCYYPDLAYMNKPVWEWNRDWIQFIPFKWLT